MYIVLSLASHKRGEMDEFSHTGYGEISAVNSINPKGSTTATRQTGGSVCMLTCCRELQDHDPTVE